MAVNVWFTANTFNYYLQTIMLENAIINFCFQKYIVDLKTVEKLSKNYQSRRRAKIFLLEKPRGGGGNARYCKI
jgi:hypothetical protein